MRGQSGLVATGQILVSAHTSPSNPTQSPRAASEPVPQKAGDPTLTGGGHGRLAGSGQPVTVTCATWW
jgi:hypothetical protein